MPPTGKKIFVIEYLRGAAALMVAWFHITLTFPPGAIRTISKWGYYGVPIFFVISGFVLPLSIWALHRDQYRLSHFPGFALRRVVRLEPPYLISIFLILMLWWLSAAVPGYAGPPFAIPTAQVASHFLYLPKLAGYDWLQPAYWTLAYEFCFYFLLGLTFPFIVRHGIWGLAVTLVLGESLAWMFRGVLDPFVPLFAMGASLFLWRQDRLSAVQFAATLFIAGLLAGSESWYLTFTGLFTCGLIAVFAERRLPTAFHRTHVLLGSISYSLYITHIPVGGRVVNLGLRFIDSEIGRLGLAFAALFVSLAFAYGFWYCVERRFVALAKRVSSVALAQPIRAS